MKNLYRTIGIGTIATSLAIAASLASVAGAQGAFTTQMQVGSRGAQVTMLQQYLAGDPTIYPSGLVTGYFGNLTRQAVINFQVRYGISAVGRVGPITLAKLNELSGGNVGGDVSAPIIVNPSVSTVNPGLATFSIASNENVSEKVFLSTSPIAMTEAQANFTEPFVSGQAYTDGNASRSTSPLVTATGLTAGVTYNYVILVKDAAGNVSVTRPASFVAR